MRDPFALSAMLTVNLVCVAMSDTHLYDCTAPVQSFLECLERTAIHKNTIFAWIFRIPDKSGYVLRIMKGVIAVRRQLIMKP